MHQAWLDVLVPGKHEFDFSKKEKALEDISQSSYASYAIGVMAFAINATVKIPQPM